MNKCHLTKELSSYLDNQLSEARKSEIEEHLKACSMCSQELNRLKMLSEKLKEWHMADLDASFDASVRDEIVARELERGEVKMKKRTLTILLPSGVLAGILVFLFLGQYYVTGRFQGKIRKTASTTIGEPHKPIGYNNYEVGLAPDASLNEVPAERGSYATGLARSERDGGKAYVEIESLGDSLGNFLARKQPERSDKSPALVDTQAYQGSVIVVEPVLPATGEGEKIIRTAEVKLEVEDGKEAYKKASGICQELGGYLAASKFYKDAEGRESGTITMRIPKDNFITALDKISALGKVETSYTNSKDVGQEYTNIKTQLDTSMIVYRKMLEALQKRQATIPEAMKLESELTPVLRRIEELKNKLEYLNNAVSFTTVTVQFHEPQASAKVLKETRHYIQQRLLSARINAVKFLADAIPAFLPVMMWVVILIVAALCVKYLITRLFKRG